ncbi:ABC transporter permease [Sphingomonas sp. Leaf242]|uniref:ABC transporter permease n=1 Tax=Sphingomonas sp. Leaf242 TaxID=1736304 RepID=UPI001F250A9A|nr:ABC transporter permease [Sphingomonas sp. Leaf242]
MEDDESRSEMSGLVNPATKFSWRRALAVQGRVIGAVLMRELHTRYGRENIGYLWLIAEPLMLGSIIALLHSGQTAHEGTINPVALTVVGYTIFIMFRGIVNRAEGTLHSNLPLLYHRMVTVFDIALARALLEAAGTFVAFTILLSLIIAIGFADFPARPLMLLAGIAYIFFFSFGLSTIIVGGTHDNTLLERLVHPFSYFMIPLSAAFYQVSWIPEPYRHYLLYNPFPQMFELVRYGQFESATLEYVDFVYMTAWTLVLNLFGLIALRAVRNRIHLS